MVTPPVNPRAAALDVARAAAGFQEVARQLGAQFLDKQEIIRLMMVSAIAGEHMVVVGPPGTAKSAMIDMFARLIDARYFEYLLTRFTEPNELFGPVDIAAFREGRYTRRIEGMLPTAEIVFLDGTLYTVRPNTLFLVTRQPGSAGATARSSSARSPA